MKAAKRKNISTFSSSVPFLLIFLVFLPCGAGDGNTQTVSITVDPSVRHQVMHGWEAAVTSTVWDDTRYVKAALPQVLDLVAYDLGLNRVQLGIFAGLENPTDYWQQYYSEQISHATFRGIRYQIINDNAEPNVINPNGFQFSQLDYFIDNFIIPVVPASPSSRRTFVYHSSLYGLRLSRIQQ